MSDDSASFMNRIANWFRISLAGWVAIGVGVTLLAIGILVGLAFHTNSERVSWREYLSWGQILLMTSFWLATCFASYWLVRIALSQLPPNEIGLIEAWKSGMDALSKRGLSIRDIPISLVLGCETPKVQQLFMQQLGMAVTVPICPEHPHAPIRWFISDERIIIACQDVGAFTLAQSRLEMQMGRLRAELPFSDLCHPTNTMGGYEADHEADTAIRGAYESTRPNVGFSFPSQDTERWEVKVDNEMDSPSVIPFPSLPGSDVGKGDRFGSIREDAAVGESSPISLSRWLGRTDSDSHSYVADKRAAEPKSIANSTANNELKERHLFGSLDHAEELVALAQQGFRTLKSPDVFEPGFASTIVLRDHGTVSLLKSSERIRSQIGLSDLCNLLVTTRLDLAPINGILVRVDAAALVRCDILAQQCGLELRQDLEQLQRQLSVQVPVSIILDNFHQVEGFQQLVKRLGPSMSAGIAIGELYGVRRPLSLVNLSTACVRLTRSLTRAIYHAFKTPDGRLRPQNQRLFPLLKLTRGGLLDSVSGFLQQAFAPSERKEEATGTGLLNGIYVMGSGDSETQRGFGGLILRNHFEESESLVWTPARLQLEQTFRARVGYLQVLCVLLSISASILLWCCC
ncbi:MAG: type VI secretion protein IcmF/TssM N-terminal domain-containing protein [Pirellula sp.]